MIRALCMPCPQGRPGCGMLAVEQTRVGRGRPSLYRIPTLRTGCRSGRVCMCVRARFDYHYLARLAGEAGTNANCCGAVQKRV